MKEQDQHGKLVIPSQDLMGVVSHYYQLFNDSSEPPVIKHLSPSLEMLLVFNFGPAVCISFNEAPIGEHIIDKIAVIGPLRKMLNYELPPSANAIVVNFMLDGFYRLFKFPLATLGEVLPKMDEIADAHYLQELWQEMSAQESTEDRLELLNSFISSLVSPPEDAALPLLDGEIYFYDPVVKPVRAISGSSGLTDRTIQLRFKKYAGYSPKELIRFLRFKAMINDLLEASGTSIDVFDLVVKFNYHDQSHLIKDFNYFLGTTPLQFLKKLKGQQFYVTGQDKED